MRTGLYTPLALSDASSSCIVASHSFQYFEFLASLTLFGLMAVSLLMVHMTVFWVTKSVRVVGIELGVTVMGACNSLLSTRTS